MAGRWTILAVGTYSQAATSCYLYGIAMLVPALRVSEHLSLFRASLIVAAPILGLMATLIVWGALADRYGERIVIASGVGAAAGLLAFAARVHGLGPLAVVLVLAGAAGGSVNAASGRMIMGWFPAEQRGLAMGVRQTAQPLGVALAALVLPSLARAQGVGAGLLFTSALCAVGALAVVVLVADPPRPAGRSDEPSRISPYRRSKRLMRVHLSSALLVVPQFAVATFTLVYLVGQRHWDPAVAGRWIFGFQVAGALGRIGTGIWSDAVGSRLRPMRQLAVASAVLMGLLAVAAALDAGWIVVGFALGAVVTVADNGLAFTSVAELAGADWAGRALGVQNTIQNVAAIASVPVLAAVIGQSGYALAFTLVALCPLLAVPLVPVEAERAAQPPASSDAAGR